MQIRYYILKVKDFYEKVLKEVTSDLQKCSIIVLYIYKLSKGGEMKLKVYNPKIHAVVFVMYATFSA